MQVTLCGLLLDFVHTAAIASSMVILVYLALERVEVAAYILTISHMFWGIFTLFSRVVDYLAHDLEKNKKLEFLAHCCNDIISDSGGNVINVGNLRFILQVKKNYDKIVSRIEKQDLTYKKIGFTRKSSQDPIIEGLLSSTV